MARSSSPASPVNRTVAGSPKKTASLKFTTKIWSPGLLDSANVRAARLTSLSLRRMLPLWSTTKPAATGISSCEKNRISWKTPSSYTSKSAC